MAGKKTEQKIIEQTPTLSNPAIPTLWIDHIDVAQRADNLCLIRLSTNLPEGIVEQGKIIVGKDFLKRFINDISKALNHYPEKPKKRTTKNKGKK